MKCLITNEKLLLYTAFCISSQLYYDKPNYGTTDYRRYYTVGHNEIQIKMELLN